jgi:hypothetical protein
MTDKDQKLFNEFPPIITQEWEAKIHADLKGKDYERALVWKTYEGLSVRPYYTSENLEGLDYLTLSSRRVSICAWKQKNRQRLVCTSEYSCKGFC